MDESSMTGTLIRRHRLVAGLTQEDLAGAAGLSVRTVRNLESGTAAPRRRTVEALVDALGLRGTSRERLLSEATSASADDAVPGLPPAPRHLIGRDEVVRRLLAWVAAGEGAVAVVHGLPGLGKTAVLLHAAHRVAVSGGRVVYVPLGGAATAHHVLGEVLTAVGVRPDQLPPATGERAALWRTLTADGTGLLVLDNAVAEAQVRPVLPAGAGWCTFVSSRTALHGLTAVHRVPLGLLTAEQGGRLITAITGGAGDTTELVSLCGGLPLALRLAAGQLTGGRTTGELVERLRDERARLDLTGPGDPEVRGTFAVSYQRLDDRERQALRRIGLVPWPVLSPEPLAALTGADVASAADVLDALADTGLLTPAGGGDRFGVHDLVRAYAAERAAAEDDPVDRERALDRAMEWLLAGIGAAAGCLEPHPDENGAIEVAYAVVPPRLTSSRAAVEWLGAHRSAWWWAIQRAAESGRNAEVVAAARGLHWYSDRQPRAVSWHRLFGLAIDAARSLGDAHQEAVQLAARGWAWGGELGRYADGLPDLDRALAVFEANEDRRNTAWTRWYRCMMLIQLGEYADARVQGLRAAELFEEVGDGFSARMALASVGGADVARGELDAAVDELTRLVAGIDPATAEPRDCYALGQALSALAQARLRRGEHEAAMTAARDAVRYVARLNSPLVNAKTLVVLGEVLADADPAEAEPVLRRVIEQAQALGSLLMEAEARFHLGRLLGGAGREAEWRRATALCEPMAARTAADLLARMAAS